MNRATRRHTPASTEGKEVLDFLESDHADTPTLPIPPLTLARMQAIRDNAQMALNQECAAVAAALGIPAEANARFDIDAGTITIPE